MTKWWKTGCRNTKLGQEKEINYTCVACANEGEDIKQTKTTERYTVHWVDGIKDLEIYKSKIQDTRCRHKTKSFTKHFFAGTPFNDEWQIN